MTIAQTYSRSAFETQVSNYDRVTAWLMASIILAGAMFLIMAPMLLLEKPTPGHFRPEPVPPTTPVVLGGVDPDNLVDPGMEAPELQTEIIDLTQFETDVLSKARARSAIHSQGSNVARGDRDGRGNGPPDIVPPRPGSESQRWKITYELSDLDTYAAQLRFFDIQLGLVSRDTNDIWRIADLGQQNRISKSSRKKENNSVYFVNSNARMARWDTRLASESNAASQGCKLSHVILVHFYPASVVESLTTLELDAISADKTVEQVNETNFRLVNNGDGFEFEVTELKFD